MIETAKHLAHAIKNFPRDKDIDLMGELCDLLADIQHAYPETEAVINDILPEFNSVETEA